MCATRQHSKPIVCWHTWEKTFSSRPPSFRPFYRATSLQFPITMRQQAFLCYSPPPLISRPRKWSTARNKIPGPTRHGLGKTLKGRSGQDTGPASPCGSHYPGDLPQHMEKIASDQGQPQYVRNPLPSNGNMALSHWLLWASIWQGLFRTPSVWVWYHRHNTKDGIGVPEFMQQHVTGKRGGRRTDVVWRTKDTGE